MTSRLFVRAASTLAATFAIGVSINACSSAPEQDGDHTATTSEAVTVCPAFQAPDGRPGHLPCTATTGGVCTVTPAPHTCGATLPAPASTCTRGMTITNVKGNPTNVWVCANGTPIPTTIGPPQGGIEHIGHLDGSQPFCSNCVGPLDSGVFFLLQWYEEIGGGGGCSGPCALGPNPK